MSKMGNVGDTWYSRTGSSTLVVAAGEAQLIGALSLGEL